MFSTDNIKSLIEQEKDNQDKKWGKQKHTPPQWISVISEELGEAAEIVNNSFESGHRAMNWEKYEEEIIQVAACCISALECAGLKWKNQQEAS